MNFWAAMKLVITFLPQFLKLLSWIKSQIDKGISEAQIKKSLEIFDKAIDKALASKDTTELEDIFRGGAK